MQSKARTLATSRAKLLESLSELESRTGLGIGKSIGGNDANFVLVPILEKEKVGVKPRLPSSPRANQIYRALAEEHGVVVRFRGNEPGCAGCLRITVGTEEENATVLKKLEEVMRII